MNVLLLRALALGALLSIAVALVPAANAQTLTQPGWTISTYASGLSQPTGFSFIGNNQLFAIEKASGQVQYINNGVKTTALDLAVNSNSERGLLGIATDPNFGTTPFVYLYYSATSGADSTTSGTWTDNRLVRYTWNGTTLVSPVTLQTLASTADSLANGPNHNGGPLTFGNDGKLYGITGDLNRDGAEQNNTATPNASTRVGTVYRLNADGTIPNDNPFIANANTNFHRDYAYGIRNSFGLAVDPVTGNVWATENGPETNDEINLVAPGFNGGWNNFTGPNPGLNPASLVNLPGSAYSDPEFTFADTNAVTGISFLSGSVLGMSDGVLVGDFLNNSLYLFHLNANRDGFVLSGNLSDLVADNNTEAFQARIGTGFGGGISEIKVGPDGAVYVSTLSGSIFRIVPEPTSLALFSLGLLGMLVARRRIIEQSRAIAD